MDRMKRTVVLIIAFLMIGGLPADLSALTPEEVRMLKEAGVEETTIRFMIEQSRPGISEEEGHIRYSTGKARREDLRKEEAEKVDRAWKMLNNLIIDARP